jgi:uncharacterized membrane protein YphA (DoxX/SURF4 family)
MDYLTSFGAPKPTAPAPNPFDALRTLAPLRIAAGLILFLYFGLPAALQGYQFVWNGTAWNWVEMVTIAGFPAPKFIAPIAGGITAVTSVSWMLGFFTRLFGVCFLPVVLGAVVVVEKSGQQAYEPFVYLLLFVTVAMVLYGSGVFSLDQLFKLVERPKMKKRRGMVDDG